MSTARSKLHHGFEEDFSRMGEAVERLLPPDATFVLLGETWGQADLVRWFQSTKAQMVAVRDAQAQVRRARKAVEDDVPRSHALFTALSASLQGYFGKQSPKLADFGIASGHRTPPTGEVLVRAAAKARLTRQLRHTLGRRQRLAVVPDGQVAVAVYAPDGTLMSASGPPSPAETAPPASPISPQAPESGE